MTRQHSLCRAAVAAGLAAALVPAGCAGGPAAAPPRPPTHTSTPSTLARVAIGDQLTVTAAVERIVDDGAFVVRDVDLTDGALLVLTRQAVEAPPPQLVTVEGTVVLFSSAGHGPGDPDAYRAFDGQKALAATRITVWR